MAVKDYRRRLNAILSTAVAGYIRLMGDDETSTASTYNLHRELITEGVQAFIGRVVNSPSDNNLSEFRSCMDAVSCAVEIQKVFKERKGDTEKLKNVVHAMSILGTSFRIGIESMVPVLIFRHASNPWQSLAGWPSP